MTMSVREVMFRAVPVCEAPIGIQEAYEASLEVTAERERMCQIKVHEAACGFQYAQSGMERKVEDNRACWRVIDGGKDADQCH